MLLQNFRGQIRCLIGESARCVFCLTHLLLEILLKSACRVRVRLVAPFFDSFLLSKSFWENFRKSRIKWSEVKCSEVGGGSGFLLKCLGQISFCIFVWSVLLNHAHSGMVWKISSLGTSYTKMTKLSMTVKTDDVTSGTMDVYPHTGG